jgi:energy-converting hydrogenase Eha subunit E
LLAGQVFLGDQLTFLSFGHVLDLITFRWVFIRTPIMLR